MEGREVMTLFRYCRYFSDASLDVNIINVKLTRCVLCVHGIGCDLKLLSY